MNLWRSAEDLTRRFRVSPATLHAFAERGNLARIRRENGESVFDEQTVARLFMPRSEDARVTHAFTARLGAAVLGESVLGRHDTAKESAPEPAVTVTV